MPKNISTIISRLQKKDVSLHAKRFKKTRLMATDKVAYRLDIANEDLGRFLKKSRRFLKKSRRFLNKTRLLLYRYRHLYALPTTNKREL